MDLKTLYRKKIKGEFLQDLRYINPSFYEREIRYSKGNYIMTILLFVGCIYFMINIYNSEKKYQEYLSILIVLILICLIAISYYIFKYRKNEIVMKIDKNGIYHKKYGLLSWDIILSVKKKNYEDSEGNITRLIFIQTNKEKTPIKIDYTSLDIKEDELKKTIRLFKDYNIYEIEDYLL